MDLPLGYGLAIDRDFAMHTLSIVQFIYASGALLLMHPLAFFLILKKTTLLSREIKVCYFLNQIQLCAHDVWGLLLYQMRPLLPYPAVYCAGFACGRGWIGGGACMAIEAAFTVHCMLLILATLLFMSQRILGPTDNLKLGRVSSSLLLLFVYMFLLLNIVGCALFANDSPDRERILNELRLPYYLDDLIFRGLSTVETRDIAWVSSLRGKIVVFGQLRDIGPFKYQVFIILASIVLVLPIRLSLVHTTIRALKTRKTLSDRTKQMQQKLATVLIRQTGMLSIFYIYPQMVVFIFILVPPDWLPQFATAAIRLLCMPLYTLSSSTQFVILLMTNERFIRTWIRSHFGWGKNRVAHITQFVSHTTATPFTTR